jgi:hypothetical protein
MIVECILGGAESLVLHTKCEIRYSKHLIRVLQSLKCMTIGNPLAVLVQKVFLQIWVYIGIVPRLCSLGISSSYPTAEKCMSKDMNEKFGTYHAPFALKSSLAQRLTLFRQFICVIFQAV